MFMSRKHSKFKVVVQYELQSLPVESSMCCTIHVLQLYLITSYGKVHTNTSKHSETLSQL